VETDRNSKWQSAWRKETREYFAFEAGEQLNDEDRPIARECGIEPPQ
jgi:hypothetical protein